MAAHSIDLRGRVVAAYDSGEGTQGRFVTRYAVSVSRIRKILRHRSATGSIAPRPHGGRALAFDAE